MKNLRNCSNKYLVEKLEKGGLYALFHTFTGKRGEKLEKGREKSAKLAIQYERVSLEFSDVKRQVELKETELATLEGYEEKFKKLLEAKYVIR